MDTGAPTVETPPPSEIGHDEDKISSLPDDLLIGILERLDLRDAVCAGALSRRWRHLPHQLSCFDLDVDDFQGTTTLKTMDAFTAALCRLLLSVSPLAECKCDCKSRRAVKTLGLCFHLSAPHLSSIGRAVEDTVSRGQTEHLEFTVVPPSSDPTTAERTKLGKQFMSFSRACPIAFRWLTGLSLTSLEFRDSDLPSLMVACDKLKHLSLRSCRLAGVFKIDVPNSIITELELVSFSCTQIELVSVPMLTELTCESWDSKNSPLRFGYVPQLREVTLSCHAATWQAPFTLSGCFSMNAMNLSTLHLNFGSHMIWIQPEHPNQLTAIFGNLTDVELWYIFPECDLSWTLFILDAAPALQMFLLSRARHSCIETTENSAEKTNVVWEPSKDLKHLNLKFLWMIGFEEEEKVANYISLVMERAAGLKRVMLCSNTCKGCNCNAVDLESLRRSEVDEASRRRIKEQLTHGSSSPVEIMICG